MLVVIDRWFDGASLQTAKGTRLVRALPHLRCLVLISIRVPSLRFIKHAPQLEELELIRCQQISPVHLELLGQATPRLTRLQLDDCANLRLDAWLLESLTPPSRLLPLLQTLDYNECRPAPEPEPEDDQPAEAESEGEGEEQPEAHEDAEEEGNEDAEEEADEEDDGAVAMDQDDEKMKGTTDHHDPPLKALSLATWACRSRSRRALAIVDINSQSQLSWLSRTHSSNLHNEIIHPPAHPTPT